MIDLSDLNDEQRRVWQGEVKPRCDQTAGWMYDQELLWLHDRHAAAGQRPHPGEAG